jgi:hypothetical protein
MDRKEFLYLCIDAVKEYTLEHIDKSDFVLDFDIYVVWSCKILQNNKAVLSTSLPDGMYYECTYNGDKDEMYLDVYKKFENRVDFYITEKFEER